MQRYSYQLRPADGPPVLVRDARGPEFHEGDAVLFRRGHEHVQAVVTRKFLWRTRRPGMRRGR
jgi:hypothetical protein